MQHRLPPQIANLIQLLKNKLVKYDILVPGQITWFDASTPILQLTRNIEVYFGVSRSGNPNEIFMICKANVGMGSVAWDLFKNTNEQIEEVIAFVRRYTQRS